MKPPSRNAVPGDIAAITEARLTFGQRGRALDTGAALRFALDHARAREAVMAELDMARIAGHLAEAGLEHRSVTSAAATRDAYIRRPDLGRTLPGAEAERLAGAGPVDVAIVLGDGLSGIAANLAGPAFVTALATRLSAAGLSHGPVVIAAQARVALGDPVAMALGAQTVVVALGERPGLSAADSLGVYITRAPPHRHTGQRAQLPVEHSRGRHGCGNGRRPRHGADPDDAADRDKRRRAQPAHRRGRLAGTLAQPGRGIAEDPDTGGEIRVGRCPRRNHD